MCHLCQRNLSSVFYARFTKKNASNDRETFSYWQNGREKYGNHQRPETAERLYTPARDRRHVLRHYSPGELLTNPFSPSEYLQFIVEGTVLLYDMPDEESTVILQTTNNKVEILGDLELLDAKFTPPFLWRRRRSSIPSRSIWSSTGSSF